MIQNSGIIKKIYFPRLIIPSASILVNLFDFLMAFLIFLVIAFVYHGISWMALFYFPLALLLTLLSAFGLGSFLAALNIKFRDFRYALPFLLQILFFASQVIYPIRLVEQTELKYLLALNPINGAIELFRSPLLNVSPDLTIVWISVGSALFLCLLGLSYFRKTESYFADIA